jgi:multidrug resistance efflux pump
MFKALFSVSVVVSLMLFGLWFHERKTHFQTMHELATCQAELKATQDNLVKYTQLYTDLRNKCELDKKQIEQRYSKLLQKSFEPVPQIQIPKTDDDCQALKEMIDEASSYFTK